MLHCDLLRVRSSSFFFLSASSFSFIFSSFFLGPGLDLFFVRNHCRISELSLVLSLRSFICYFWVYLIWRLYRRVNLIQLPAPMGLGGTWRGCEILVSTIRSSTAMLCTATARWRFASLIINSLPNTGIFRGGKVFFPTNVQLLPYYCLTLCRLHSCLVSSLRVWVQFTGLGESSLLAIALATVSSMSHGPDVDWVRLLDSLSRSSLSFCCSSLISLSKLSWTAHPDHLVLTLPDLDLHRPTLWLLQAENLHSLTDLLILKILKNTLLKCFLDPNFY